MSFDIILRNKKAFHDYEILLKVEAGVALQGTEVKSLRLGKVKLGESHVAIDGNREAWIFNMSIPQYAFGNWTNHQEDRKRKLLLHKRQIEELLHRLKTQGITLIPLSIYFKDGKVKLEIGLARGKKKFDKRQDEIKKDSIKKIRQVVDR